MNQSRRETVVCKYCLAFLRTQYSKKRIGTDARQLAQITVEDEHQDKLDCAKEVVRALAEIDALIGEMQRRKARLLANEAEIQKLATLRHPGLASKAPSGMKHTESGLVVPG